MSWKTNIYGVRPIKYTEKEKEKINRLKDYGISYENIKKISKKIMKKVYAHGDSSESTSEFVKKHPEYFNLSWKEKKKMLKKRFPYLAGEEIDYLGKISGDFED